jgi:tetratricopeptide (TPR) repeat protein
LSHSQRPGVTTVRKLPSRRQLAAGAAALGVLIAAMASAQVEPHRSEPGAIQGYKVARASYENARKYFEKRDLEKAREELEHCLKRMPQFSDAHFLLAKIEYLEKRFPEALAHMDRAAATYVAFGALYADRQSDRRKEVERLRSAKGERLSDLRAQLSQLTSPEARLALEMQIARLQQEHDALQGEILEPLEAGMGMPADYHFFHGNILLRLKRLDDAAAQYREALRVDPTHRAATNNLASLYLDAGQPRVAKDVLDQAEAAGVLVDAELRQAVLNAIK